MRIYIGDQKRPAWHVFKSLDEIAFFKEWSRYLKKKDVMTMYDVLERYEAQVVPKKATDTQISDRKALAPLRLAFGNMRPEDVTPTQICAYVDHRGRRAAVRANREVALLSNIFTKCLHWGLLEHNPALKLRYRNPESPRDRYVTDRELWRALRLAPPLIRYAMYLCVMTGLRRRDVLGLRWKDFGEEGLTVTLSKSKRAGASPKRLLFEWTPSLRRLLHRVGDLQNDFAYDAPFFNISESAFEYQWTKYQNAVVAAEIPRFQMKDLRAKYGTDLDERGGDATRSLAHSSAATTKRHYQRKPTRITTPGVKNAN